MSMKMLVAIQLYLSQGSGELDQDLSPNSKAMKLPLRQAKYSRADTKLDTTITLECSANPTKFQPDSFVQLLIAYG